jgi:S-adenosylmethionine-diacylglycerol 3-amino-3-carboxypropyl transferase
MSDTLPSWVAEAASWPVAFAQVREDPRIDRFVVERAGANARVCMVASGGCTAAVLVTMSNVAAVHLVDPNPAQLALARLKLRLLGNTDGTGAERQAILGHSAVGSAPTRGASGSRRALWSALGLPAGVARAVRENWSDGVRTGCVGRYERVLRSRSKLELILADKDEELRSGARALDDPTEQARHGSRRRRPSAARSTRPSIPR